MSDRIQELVTEAHTYFSDTMFNEMVDMDQEVAIGFLNDFYGFPCPKRIENYFAVVGQLGMNKTDNQLLSRAKVYRNNLSLKYMQH